MNNTEKPEVPPYSGRQFAKDSATPEEIGVHRDEYWNEIPRDREEHKNATPEHSNSTYTGRQYDTIVRSPNGMEYGVSVSGKPMASSVSVTGDEANRGKES